MPKVDQFENERVGAALAALRKRARMSQAEVAEAVSMRRDAAGRQRASLQVPWLSRVERHGVATPGRDGAPDKHAYPSLKLLDVWLEALGSNRRELERLVELPDAELAALAHAGEPEQVESWSAEVAAAPPPAAAPQLADAVSDFIATWGRLDDDERNRLVHAVRGFRGRVGPG